jgi:hypothetical protein
LGTYEQSKKELSYDKMFHLGLFAMVGNEIGQFYSVVIEKNEVIHIEKANFNLNGEKDVISVSINPNIRITLNDFLNNCQQFMGAKYFMYDAFTNNCQMYIKSLIESNNLSTPQLIKFIYQPVETMIRNLPKSTQVFAKTLTNIGGIFNRLTGGALPPKEQTMKAEADYKAKLKARKLDPKNDAYYNLQDKNKKISQTYGKGNSDYMKLDEAQKARYMRSLKQRQQDYTDFTNDRLQREQEEIDRLEREREKANDPWSGLTDVVESAVSYIPVVGSVVAPAISALRGRLEGLGLPRKKVRGRPRKI